MKRPMGIVVPGKKHAWFFVTHIDPDHLEEMEADGLVIYETCYTIPHWVARLGLARFWMAAQDAWQFMRMW